MSQNYTWTERTSAGARNWFSITSSSDGTKLVALAYNGYIYTSTNSGIDWTERTTAGSRLWRQVASSSDGMKLIAANYDGYLYTSTNYGVDWVERTLPGSRLWCSVASSSDGNTLIAVAYGNYIYISTNSGINWTTRSPGIRNWWSVASSADGTKLSTGCDGEFIYVSPNSGLSWYQRAQSRRWSSIASSSDGTKLAATAYGNYIFTSTNSGVNWTEQPASGIRNWHFVCSSNDGTKLAAVVEDGYIYTSTDGGISWTEQTALGSKIWRSIASSSDGSKLAAVDFNNGYIYTGENQFITSSVSPLSYCQGSSISVGFAISGVFNFGNTFTAQLSNSSGSFNNPTNIGTLNGTVAGTINCTISTATYSGSGYRIRVISTDPAIIGSDNGSNITINLKPNPTITGNNSACEKNIISFSTPNSGNTYKWSVINGTIQGYSDASIADIQMGTGDSTVVKVVETIASTGCKDSATKTVYLNHLPYPSINGSNSVCEKALETYSTTKVTGNTYQWFITNGIIQGADDTSKVLIKWNSGTSGNVKVIETTASGCKDSSSLTITINPLPKPSITPTTPVCAQNEVVYNMALTAGHEYKWSVIGGTISGVDNSNIVTVNWANSGTGIIKMVETITSTGCKDSIQFNITINPLPIVALVGTEEACEKGFSDFFVNKDTNYSYKWSVTNGNIIGSSTLYNATINWGNAGTATVKSIVTDNTTGCKDSVTKMVTINPTPKPQISGSISVCEKNKYTYSSDVTTDIDNMWSVVNGTVLGSQTGQSVDILWAVSGTGTIILTQTNTVTGCKDSTTLSISINSLPKVKIIGPSLAKKDSSYVYSSTATNITSEWSVMGGNIIGASTNSNITVCWVNTGIGKMKLIQTDLTTGCKDSSDMDVDINSSKIVVTGPNSVCVNSRFMYSTPTIAGATNHWLLYKNGKVQPPPDVYADSIWVNWTVAGIWEIHLIHSASNGAQETVIITVTIHPLPKTNFSGSDSTTIGKIEKYSTDTDLNILNFWSAVNGEIKGNTNLSDAYILWNAAGNGKVKLLRVDSMTGCEDSSEIDVRILSVNEVIEKPQDEILQVFPNPFDQFTVISFSASIAGNVDFKLFDLTGQIIISKELSIKQSGKYLLKIDGKSLNSGIYYATVWINGIPTTKKVVIIH